jgi:hypothetical protein
VPGQAVPAQTQTVPEPEFVPAFAAARSVKTGAASGGPIPAPAPAPAPTPAPAPAPTTVEPEDESDSSAEDHY